MASNSKIPASWKWVQIQDLYDVLGGGTPSTKVEQYWSGDIPWITSADIHGWKDIQPRKKITRQAIKDSATNLVPANTIIVVTRVSLGKVAITPYPLCFSQDSQGLVPKTEIIDQRFALYYLTQATQEFRHTGRGTTISGVTKKQLKTLEMPLAPLPEQSRIVAKIEELFSQLDAGVEALRRARAKLKRYKASVLKAACEGRLVPTEAELTRKDGREYEPAAVLLERIAQERGKLIAGVDGLYELPEGWAWTKLAQLGELSRGRSKHRPRDAQYLYGGPYPFIQTGDIRNSEGTILRFKQTYSEEGLAQSRLWPVGTLCITIAANIAETAILGIEACFPDSVVGFIGHKGISAQYIELFIRTIKDDLERYAPATAQKNINLRTLQNIFVALPPTAEQERITKEFEQRSSIIRVIEKTIYGGLARAERLRQAVLKRAFEGKLITRGTAD
jgi:type I restriction enzyme S subunit